MKNLLFVATILAMALSTKGQDSTHIFRASDPTQTYMFLEPSAGITFWTAPNYFGPDNWQFNLKGQVAIKKFAISFLVPITNVGSSYSLLGDVALDAKYQLFYNSQNFLHTSSIQAGITFPTSYDGFGLEIGTYDRGFFNYFLGYTAGLNLTDKFKLYPTLEIKKYQSVERGSLYFTHNDSLYTYPSVTQLAFGTGLILSYDFNTKNFIQLGVHYETGTWKSEDGTSLSGLDDGSISQSVWRTNFKYQHAFTNKAQAFVKLSYSLREYFGEPINSHIGYSQLNLTLGFQYYID